MNWQRFLIIFAILVFAVAYYGLATIAIRDLLRRPAVRGDNKVAWGLLILCLPIAGALIYGYTGAASFLPRAHTSSVADSSSTQPKRGKRVHPDRHQDE